MVTAPLRSLATGAILVLAFVCADSSAEQGVEPSISARSLAALADIDGLSISPRSRLVAFQISQAVPDENRYETAWYTAVLDGKSAPRRIADAGEPISPRFLGRQTGAVAVYPPAWSPDGEWIAYLRKDGDRIQVWRSQLDGSRSEQLTHNEGNARAIAYSADGHRLFFETEPTVAQTEAALSNEARRGFLYDRRYSPGYGTRPVVMTDPEESAARIVWAYDFRTRLEQPATHAERADYIAKRTLPAQDDRSVAWDSTVSLSNGARVWTEARDPQRQGIWRPLTLIARLGASAEPIVCPAPECTGQKMTGAWWRNDNEIIFSRREGSVFQDTALYAWRPREKTVRKILRTPGKLIGTPIEWRCAIAQDRLICFYELANHPRRLAAVDLDTGAIGIIHDPNQDFRRSELGSPPSRVEIRSPSNVETFGYLVLPSRRRSSAPLPLVIVTYRCSGFLRGGTGDEYPIYPFAAQGFAVLCIDVPTEDYGRGATLGAAAYDDWARGPTNPIKNRIQDALNSAVAQLHAAGLIDRDRIGLTGLSYGAETVSFALFNMRHLATAISSGGGLEPSAAFLWGPQGPEALASFGLGSPNSPRWNALSLAKNVAKVRSPWLINVADREMLYTLEAVTALTTARRAVEMYVFPDEYHVKLQPAHRLAIYNRNIDWMNFWLHGRQDSDPAKAEQYARWRTLRANQCELFSGADAPWYCRQRSSD